MGVSVQLMGSGQWTVERRTEQITMVRQSLVLALATIVTMSYSQSSQPRQYQFNDGGRTRFARRVISGLEPSDRNNLGRDEASRRREFSPLFDSNSPYLMIDSEKFTVLPAVPSLGSQRSQKSLDSNNNQNFLFPSTSTHNLKPIPAVPAQKTTSTKTPRRGKPQTSFPRFPVTPPSPTPPPPPRPSPPPPPPPPSPSSSRETRKKFKKCHGRCVQKFCLPVGSLAKHQACQDSCKDICTL